VANVLQKFSNRRTSSPSPATRRSEPQLGLRLLSLQLGLEPGELLEFEYAVHRVPPDLVDSLEASVMWYTEGKGSEDIGIHLFQRVSREELTAGTLDRPRRITCPLPSSPLSFEGRLLKIRWCVRLRLFLKDGRELTADKPFYLGHLTTDL
jgi:hypothetical protein